MPLFGDLLSLADDLPAVRLQASSHLTNGVSQITPNASQMAYLTSSTPSAPDVAEESASTEITPEETNGASTHYPTRTCNNRFPEILDMLCRPLRDTDEPMLGTPSFHTIVVSFTYC